MAMSESGTIGGSIEIERWTYPSILITGEIPANCSITQSFSMLFTSLENIKRIQMDQVDV